MWGPLVRTRSRWKWRLLGGVAQSSGGNSPCAITVQKCRFLSNASGRRTRAEVAHYIDQCRAGAPFAVDHRDGLRALEIAMVGSGALQGREGGVAVDVAERS